MEITEVKVFPRQSMDSESEKLKAYASITFDRTFVVRGLKIVEGKNGLYVLMPSRKLADGTFKDIAHPLNNAVRKNIESKVLDSFSRLLQDTGLRSQ